MVSPTAADMVRKTIPQVRAKTQGKKKKQIPEEAVDIASDASRVQADARKDWLATPGITSRKKLYIVSIICILLVLGYTIVERGLVVAAIVNGKPIFSWDVYSILMSRFGQQTLEGLISEKLIAQEAEKRGIVATQEEIDAKIQEIVGGLGEGASIDEFLAFQGMTQKDFQEQIRLQLQVQKILEQEVVLQENEITAYMDEQMSNVTVDDPVQRRNQARKALLEQKVGEKTQPWFTNLKDSSKIVRFLN